MEQFIQTIGHVNFRSGPEISSTVIKNLDPSTVVQVIGTIDGTTWYRGKLDDGTEGYITSKPAYVQDYEPTWLTTAKKILDYGQRYLSKPIFDVNDKPVMNPKGYQAITYDYVFGSNRTTDTDFDCSDLQQWIFGHAAGIHLGWTSRAQAKEGTAIDPKDVRTGDLVFFAYADGYIHHVSQVVKAGPHADEQDQLFHTFRPGIGVTFSSFAPGSYWHDHANLVVARRMIQG